MQAAPLSAITGRSHITSSAEGSKCLRLITGVGGGCLLIKLSKLLIKFNYVFVPLCIPCIHQRLNSISNECLVFTSTCDSKKLRWWEADGS